MFLIIGYRDESTIKHFLQFLKDRRHKPAYDFLDLCKVSEAKEVSAEFQDDLIITIGKQKLDFSKYKKIYSRCFARQNEEHCLTTQKVIRLLNSYLEDSGKIIINKPSAGHSNYSKLYHARKLKTAGFIVPETWVLGSSALAKMMVKVDEGWINKGISSMRTKAIEFDFFHYVNLDLLDTGPSLFQKKAEGDDVRIHLVDQEFIALKITSEDTDYRYSHSENEYSETEVPKEILKKCIAFCRGEGLIFAGIDFKVNSIGEWQMLEVNPMPGYNYFDKKLDLKISTLLLKFLSDVNQPKTLNQNHYGIDRPFIAKDRRKMS